MAFVAGTIFVDWSVASIVASFATVVFPFLTNFFRILPMVEMCLDSIPKLNYIIIQQIRTNLTNIFCPWIFSAWYLLCSHRFPLNPDAHKHLGGNPSTQSPLLRQAISLHDGPLLGDGKVPLPIRNLGFCFEPLRNLECGLFLDIGTLGIMNRGRRVVKSMREIISIFIAFYPHCLYFIVEIILLELIKSISC